MVNTAELSEPDVRAEPVHLDPRSIVIRSSAKTAQTIVTGRVSATDQTICSLRREFKMQTRKRIEASCRLL